MKTAIHSTFQKFWATFATLFALLIVSMIMKYGAAHESHIFVKWLVGIVIVFGAGKWWLSWMFGLTKEAPKEDSDL